MSGPRATYIFATRGDMEPGLKAIEEKHALQYVVRGLFPQPLVRTYHSAFDLPGLGVSEAGDLNLQTFYLVLPKDHEVQVRPVPQRRGGMLYAIDEVGNPPAMIWIPGGFHGEECLIVGEVVGTSDPRSCRLHRSFTRQFLKGFTHLKRYYVGPEALRLLRQGGRLTHGAERPPICDLVEVGEG